MTDWLDILAIAAGLVLAVLVAAAIGLSLCRGRHRPGAIVGVTSLTTVAPAPEPEPDRTIKVASVVNHRVPANRIAQRNRRRARRATCF